MSEQDVTEREDPRAPPGASTELPVVTLGTADEEHEQPRVRLVPGRVAVSVVTYPIYMLLVLTGGVAGNVAIDTGEWSLGAITVSWVVAFGWSWIYAVAWYYRRSLLKWTSATFALGMFAVLALACMDRAAAQLVDGGEGLVFRAPIESLAWAAGGLVVCAALLLSHLVYLGRGYRVRGEVAQEG